MVGATRESVNKALALLRSQNLIKTPDARMIITDKSGLEKLLTERGR
jgi:CRP-like cAMP-binding protein